MTLRRPVTLAVPWLVVATIATVTARTADAPAAILPPEAREPVRAVAEQIICFCGCARQTVADCECALAGEIRASIWSDLTSGKPPSSIVDAYVGAHGAEFRSMPEHKGLGIAAWYVPYAAIGIGAVAVLSIVRRWTRVAAAPAAAPRAGAPEPDGDRYARAVEEEVGSLD